MYYNVTVGYPQDYIGVRPKRIMETVSHTSELETNVPAVLKSISFNRKELRSQIVIDAPRETVWNILTDFDRFPEWNPFITKVSGRIEVNARLTVTMHPPGGRRTTFEPSVLKVEPNATLQWLGHLGISGLFDGQHTFELKSLGDDRTLFVQREQFGGMLLPFLTRMLGNETTRGFNEMNQALKRRAEEPRAPERR